MEAEIQLWNSFFWWYFGSRVLGKPGACKRPSPRVKSHEIL